MEPLGTNNQPDDELLPVLAFAATFSFEPLERWLRFWLAELKLRARLAFAGYGQLQHELRNPQAFRGAGACIGLLNFADWQRGSTSEFDVVRFEADLALFVESLRAALTRCPRLVLLLCPTRPSATAGVERGRAFNAAASQLQELAKQEPRLSVLTSSELASWYPVQEPYDIIADEIGHLPYTASLWCALGAACVRMLLPILAPPLKAVVVDCDYTLWHNAVGEVGATGIVCAPRHRELQERLLALRQAGVLICLCSRNVEEDVWAALESGETTLHRDHITAARIDPHLRKSDSIQQLASELRLAPESFFFIDDNPAECLEVRSVLPEVPTWCMPQVHAEAKQQLPHVWRLDVHAGSSVEDSKRVESYKAEIQREALRKTAGSLSDFHRELQVRIDIQELSEASLAVHERVLQMQQRTNQFNAWKRHPVPPTVLSRSETLVMRVTDRYGDYGIVGASLSTRDGDCLRVLSLMMSCRVLGRGAEHALLRATAQLALRTPSCKQIAVGVVEAERNQPILRFLRETVASIPGSSWQQASSCTPSESMSATHVDKNNSADNDTTVDSCQAWLTTSPTYWYCFPAEQLAGLTFHPEKEATAETDMPTETEAGPIQQAGHNTQVEMLHGLASALTDIPANLRTVQQVMLRCGCELMPPASLEGCSSEDKARQLLRLVWRHVLQLPAPTENELEAQDDVPFAACGGDSVLAVQLISLAAQYGLRIPRSLNIEMMTIRQLVQACDFSTTRQDRSGPLADGVTASTRVRDSMQILERDSRTPKAELRVSGISSCAAGNLDEARHLASMGGWHPAYAVDRHRNTALMWAAGMGQLHIAKWLLEEIGTSVDTANKDGRSALMWACKNGKLPVVRYLLEEGGANAMLRMKDDSTAFDWAVLGGDIPTMEYMAAHPAVDLHALNKFGCSAVQWAAASGNVVTCQWLHSKGIDFTHVNQARHGAVNKAAWKGHNEALKWMLLDEAGPKLTEQLLLLDHEGLSVAQLARMGGHGEIADWLQSLAEGVVRESGTGPAMLEPEALAREKARCIAR